MDIKDKVAIVTGGASGLGRATVERFLDRGSRAVIFDRDRETGEAAAAELGGNTLFCAVDVAEEDSVAEGIAAAMDRFGAIHVCVNCAGRGSGATKTMSRKGRFPLDLFRDVININLVGTFNVLTQAVEKMVENEPDENGERGVIVNTSSIAAFEGQKGQVAYAASKGGLVSITLPIARDLAYYNIRIATIAPGVFDTPILKGVSEEVKAGLAHNIPNPHRLGDVREFAALAEHIVSNSYINGETIRLDAALRM